MREMIPVPPGQAGQSHFDAVRQTHPDSGDEFWSARDLMPFLGYTDWRNFGESMERAKIACGNTGCEPSDHFVGADKVVSLGSGAVRRIEDVRLTRYAAYLVAMNGDPRKPEIAAAQAYFVIQTRRAEMHLPPISWEQARLKGKTVRREFTDVLRDHAVAGPGYAQCTEAINRRVFGKPTAAFRGDKGLVKKSQATRDHCNATEIVNICLSEQVAANRIDRDDLRGNKPCAIACDDSAKDVMAAVQQLLLS